jgi:hypothetical protein
MEMKSEVKKQKKYYTSEEAYERLRVLDNLTLVKLEQAVCTYAFWINMDPKELLGEIFTRIFEGRRQWPVDVNIFILVKKIAHSIVSHAAVNRPVELSMSLGISHDLEVGDTISDPNSITDMPMIIKELRSEVLSLFPEEDCRDVLECRLDGLKRREVINLLKITENEYDRIWVQIQRRIRNTPRLKELL